MSCSLTHPIKICHVIDASDGAAWVFDQLKGLRDLYGCDVAAVLSGDRGGLADSLIRAAIPLHTADFVFHSPLDLLRLPWKLMALARLFRQERYQVVQSHLFRSMVMTRTAAWLADVPARFSMIAGPFHLEAPTPRWIDGCTWWMETGIIASCRHTRELYRDLGVPKDHIALIFYGADQQRFDPRRTKPADLKAEFGWPADTKLIGMVARFYGHTNDRRWTPAQARGKSLKGHEDLIRATPEIIREFPNAKVLLIGGPWEEAGVRMMSSLHALVAELGLGNSVIFTGFRSDIPEVLGALDVSVQPSLTDNLGGTIESLLMERPTVATRVGGLVDTVIDSKTGVLVAPNAPSELAGAVIGLLHDPNRARSLGQAGRKYMLRGFTLHHTIDDLASLYARARATSGSGYRIYVTVLRLLLLGPIAAGVVLRYLVIDTLIPQIREKFCNRAAHRGA